MIEQKDAINQNLSKENADLQLQLADARHQYESAMANIGKFGGSSLPVPLIGELTTFAQQNPDIVEFDDKKGLVKFKSDVAFSPGSAIVKPEVKGVIDRLAGILNGPTASNYELMVVGHTDNMPVSNPATKKAGHLDNWYLSAHRAIAVSQTLISQGTSARRIEVAGCADQRPIVPNDSEANKGKNRRVEVFILPTTIGSSPAPIAPQPPVVQAPTQPKKTTNVRTKPLDKDGATADIEKKPFLSK
jgi:chemotaxis protein MotB